MYRFFFGMGRSPCEIESEVAPEFADNRLKTERNDQHHGNSDQFEKFKRRFLQFKQHNYVENTVHYHKLAEFQAPKFMVIACSDSRVCPSTILGFRTGEAFTVRNIANLVPPFKHGASETSAALEFAVNTLHVEHIWIIGHSRCGGIKALVNMKDDTNTKGFVNEWVSIAKSAKETTKKSARNLSLEMQCQHCEKLSINESLRNLLTYPWIERRVVNGKLLLHGGYYDLENCNFEKWTLQYEKKQEGSGKCDFINESSWS